MDVVKGGKLDTANRRIDCEIDCQVWNLCEFLRKRNEAEKSGDNQPVV